MGYKRYRRYKETMEPKRYKRYGKPIALLLLFLFVTGAVLAGRQNISGNAVAKKNLVVSFVDVGQGNATLIQYKDKNVLVDTGEEGEYSHLKKFLAKKKVSRIHTLVITHNDSDHMGGADLVLEDFTVDKVVQSVYAEDKDTYSVKEVKAAIEKYQIPLVSVKAGDTIKIASGVQAEVLSPAKDYGDSNGNSVVLKLTHGKNSFLLTGDIDAKVEKEILQQYDIAVDVLQVAHHGSDYSSAILFLSKANPCYAVISVGEGNSYGHPADTVVKRLKNFAKKIYRTDKNGSITFTSDGKKLSVTTTGERKALSGNDQKQTDNGTDNPAKETESIIGNKNSKVYHTPSCGNLPYEQNRIYFDSRKEAEAEGYRPHTACCK